MPSVINTQDDNKDNPIYHPGVMAKAKKKKAGFLKLNPHCCLCGGDEPATTVDHIPPAIFFNKKHRPQGFEFPACNRCNHGTSQEEQVAAMIARLNPDPNTQDGQDEVVKIMEAVNRNHPEILEELRPSAREQRTFMKERLGLKPGRDGSPSRVPIMKLGGPKVMHCLNTFARKLTCSVHKYRTDQIIPPSGVIWVRIFSNIEFEDMPFPDDFLKLLGDPLTLKQGRFSVEDQFAIRMANSVDGRISAFFAKFRLAYGIVGAAHCDPPDDFGPKNAEMYHPFTWTDD